MLFNKTLTRGIIVWSLILLAVFTRFFKLNWGDGFFFNPDENNMATAVSQMSLENLNPHFFAYGQFPLYLTFFSRELLNWLNTFTFAPNIDFSAAIFGLRFWSAVFSVGSIYLFYLISKNLSKNTKFQLLFVLLLIFNPGLIQSAHFGTTESLLIFVFAANILLAQKIIKDKNNSKLILLAGLISGVGLAAKLSALILTGPVFLALFINLLTDKKIIKTIFSILIFLGITASFALLLSPYNFLTRNEFVSSMNYEISVATGRLHVFYTNQFLNSIPYLFQFEKIFPYINGLPVFLLFFVGLVSLLRDKKRQNIYWLLILLPVLVYFIYNGQLFVKWTRFMSPVFFVFPLLASYALYKIKSQTILSILIILAVLPGIWFINLYLKPDLRIQASEWITTNISRNSIVLSESGNVVDLPVFGNPNIINFDFYSLDKNQTRKEQLAEILNQSNFIVIPSRRVFKNQSNPEFPTSLNYYQNLFSGNLGFSLIKEFSPNTDILLKPENAEETWSVFDRPTIRIYQKTKPLNINDYQKILND